MKYMVALDQVKYGKVEYYLSMHKVNFYFLESDQTNSKLCLSRILLLRKD